MSRAQRLADQGTAAVDGFWDTFHAMREHFPCEHGHLSCSVARGGRPCMNELELITEEEA